MTFDASDNIVDTFKTDIIVNVIICLITLTDDFLYQNQFVDTDNITH
jgi:hypothetical protein